MSLEVESDIVVRKENKRLMDCVEPSLQSLCWSCIIDEQMNETAGTPQLRRSSCSGHFRVQ